MYRIHWMDLFGEAMLEANDYEEYREIYDMIKENPDCDDIWVEHYDEDYGYWEV